MPAVPVPGRREGVGHGVGEDVGLTGLHRPDHEASEPVGKAVLVGEPAGVGRPDGAHGGPVVGVAAQVGGHHPARGHLHHLHPGPVVHEGDAAPVGGPRRIPRHLRLADAEGPGRAQPVLRPDAEAVAVALVREPGHRIAQRGPDRRAVGGSVGAGQVAGGAMLHGDAEDLSPGLHDGSLPGGREPGCAHVRAHVHPAGTGPGEVPPHRDGDPLGGPGPGVQRVDPPVVFVNQHPGAAREVLDVHLGLEGELIQGARGHVVGPDVGGRVPVREEVDLAVHPDRVGVGEVLARDQHFVQRGEVQHHQGNVLATPVPAPLRVPLGGGHHGHAFAVGREAALEAEGGREERGGPALRGNRPEPTEVRGRGLPPGAVEDAGAVGAPSPCLRCTRVPGEPRGVTPLHANDMHLRRPGLGRGEGDALPVGREVGSGHHRRGRREPPGLATGAVHDPEVPAVGEGDVLGADGRLPEESRVLGSRFHGGEGREQDEAQGGPGTDGDGAKDAWDAKDAKQAKDANARGRPHGALRMGGKPDRQLPDPGANGQGQGQWANPSADP